MTYELDLFGVLVPSLMLWSVLAYVLARGVSNVMGRIGLYRHVWHPALFDFAVYVCIVTSFVYVPRSFSHERPCFVLESLMARVHDEVPELRSRPSVRPLSEGGR
jgi:hypothetical protein